MKRGELCVSVQLSWAAHLFLFSQFATAGKRVLLLFLSSLLLSVDY